MFVAGCRPSGAVGPDPPISPAPGRVLLADVVEGVFVPSCSSRSCHGAAGGQDRLVLEGAGLRDRLVGLSPTNAEAVKQGYGMVVPGQPGRSWLLAKMAGPPPGGWDRMPPGRMPDAAQLALVRAWIEQGALP